MFSDEYKALAHHLLHGPAPDRGISVLLRLAILILGFIAIFMLSFLSGAVNAWAPLSDGEINDVLDPVLLSIVRLHLSALRPPPTQTKHTDIAS